MSQIIISDPTLRDGNHAVKHKITLDQVRAYVAATDKAGVDIIELGHGCGLGGSSIQFGYSAVSDQTVLSTAKSLTRNAKIGIHIIPGIGRISTDLCLAIEAGVDVVRVASHCTEADTTERCIKYAASQQKEVYGVLMMSHMADKQVLYQEASKMLSYGASAIMLMDSAGAYFPQDVSEKVAYLRQLAVPIGFHAHNNLGLSVANSLAAVEAGATIIDGTAKGFGAGAGNTPIEVIVAVLDKQGYELNVDLDLILRAAEIAEQILIPKLPTISPLSVISGLAGGVFRLC